LFDGEVWILKTKHRAAYRFCLAIMLLLLSTKKWHNIIYTFFQDMLPHTIWGRYLKWPSTTRVRAVTTSF